MYRDSEPAAAASDRGGAVRPQVDIRQPALHQPERLVREVLAAGRRQRGLRLQAVVKEKDGEVEIERDGGRRKRGMGRRTGLEPPLALSPPSKSDAQRSQIAGSCGWTGSARSHAKQAPHRPGLCAFR